MGVFRAVFWSFFGVRKGHDLEQDAHQLRPVQVILAGLLSAALMVVGLVLLVLFITRQTN